MLKFRLTTPLVWPHRAWKWMLRRRSGSLADHTNHRPNFSYLRCSPTIQLHPAIEWRSERTFASTRSQRKRRERPERVPKTFQRKYPEYKRPPSLVEEPGESSAKPHTHDSNRKARGGKAELGRVKEKLATVLAAKDWEEADRLFDVALTIGPDRGTFSLFMGAVAKANQVKRMEYVLSVMQDRGLDIPPEVLGMCMKVYAQCPSTEGVESCLRAGLGSELLDKLLEKPIEIETALNSTSYDLSSSEIVESDSSPSVRVKKTVAASAQPNEGNGGTAQRQGTRPGSKQLHLFIDVQHLQTHEAGATSELTIATTNKQWDVERMDLSPRIADQSGLVPLLSSAINALAKSSMVTGRIVSVAGTPLETAVVLCFNATRLYNIPPSKLPFTVVLRGLRRASGDPAAYNCCQLLWDNVITPFYGLDAVAETDNIEEGLQPPPFDDDEDDGASDALQSLDRFTVQSLMQTSAVVSEIAFSMSQDYAQRMVSQTISLMRVAKERKCLPTDLRVYNAMLAILSKAKDVDACCEIFDTIQDAGMKRDITTYEYVLDVLSRSKDIQDLELFSQVWSEMLKKQVRATLKCYNSMIRAWGRMGKLESALKVVVFLESAKTLAPNERTYHELVVALMRAKKPSLALEVEERAKTRGISLMEQTSQILRIVERDMK